MKTMDESVKGGRVEGWKGARRIRRSGSMYKTT
jgi:hypothetical protein